MCVGPDFQKQLRDTAGDDDGKQDKGKNRRGKEKQDVGSSKGKGVGGTQQQQQQQQQQEELAMICDEATNRVATCDPGVALGLWDHAPLFSSWRGNIEHG
jgi:hypothetical protein